jgi:hypothetical protein
VVNFEELFAIHPHPVTRRLVVRGLLELRRHHKILPLKVSVFRKSVRALLVSESSISASLEAMVVVLLKEMSRGNEASDKLLILATTISASIPPGYTLFQEDLYHF